MEAEKVHLSQCLFKQYNINSRYSDTIFDINAWWRGGGDDMRHSIAALSQGKELFL